MTVPTDADLGDAPPLSEAARAALADIVEHRIAWEYGRGDRDGLALATTRAALALREDLRDEYVTANGTARGLEGYASATMHALVREGLARRRCQCSRLQPAAPGSSEGKS
ncbi:hypothetical protein [Micromonospora sp. NPDC005652]|uniref:hypothetical protein n=1 Tax=Micromonospora sp. NPDC005652 TaxID=3157046 RepID=UPI0033CC3058